MAQLQTIQQVQAELGARIGVIGARAARARPDDIAREIDLIRQVARRNGMLPAVAVSSALESALARGERGPLIQGWLSILSDAIGCDRHDQATCDTFAAACSVRFSS
jgi:hypothetical protein